MRKSSRAKDAIDAHYIALEKVTLNEINTTSPIGATFGTKYSESTMKTYEFE